MGLFGGKKKVAVSVIADSLAQMVAATTTKENMQELFGDSVEDQNDQQYIEWAAANMFAATRGIRTAVKDPSLQKALLDGFHAAAFRLVLSNDRQRIAFETMLKERYDKYFEALRDPVDPAFRLGSTFSQFFATGTSARLGLLGAQEISHRMVLIVDFLQKVQAKFEII